MKSSLFFTFLLLLFWVGETGKGEITILGHKWCKKSKLAYDIVKKMEETHGKEFIFTYNIGNVTNHSDTPFPTISIACSSQITIYENQLTFLQFEYWVNILCQNTIPQCKKWMQSDHTYQVNPIQPTLLFDWIKQNPSVKICLNSSVLPERDHKIIQLLQNIENLQYFKTFSHNLRNQLIRNGKTVIAFLYKKRNSKLKDFQTHYQRLKQTDKRLGYHLSERGRQNVVFLSDNLKKKIIKKLLKFINIKQEQSDMIVWFKFVEGELIGGIYGTFQMDNMFTYWVQEMTKYTQKTSQTECLSNSLTHFYQQNSLLSVQQNTQLQKWMKKINTFQKITLISHPVSWIDPQKQFVFCRAGKLKEQTGNIQQIKQAILQLSSISPSQEL